MESRELMEEKLDNYGRVNVLMDSGEVYEVSKDVLKNKGDSHPSLFPLSILLV